MKTIIVSMTQTVGTKAVMFLVVMFMVVMFEISYCLYV